MGDELLRRAYEAIDYWDSNTDDPEVLRGLVRELVKRVEFEKDQRENSKIERLRKHGRR